jgi:hypothetical protein
MQSSLIKINCGAGGSEGLYFFALAKNLYNPSLTGPVQLSFLNERLITLI